MMLKKLLLKSFRTVALFVLSIFLLKFAVINPSQAMDEDSNSDTLSEDESKARGTKRKSLEGPVSPSKYQKTLSGSKASGSHIAPSQEREDIPQQQKKISSFTVGGTLIHKSAPTHAKRLAEIIAQLAPQTAHRPLYQRLPTTKKQEVVKILKELKNKGSISTQDGAKFLGCNPTTLTKWWNRWGDW